MWHVPGTNDLLIIMEIPATIEFLSSLRSSLQLLAIKNRIKTTAEKPKGMKLKLTQNISTRTLKQGYNGISTQKWKTNNKNTANHGCFSNRIFLGRKFHLMPAHNMES